MKFLVCCEIIVCSINLFASLYINLKILRNRQRNRKKYEEELEFIKKTFSFGGKDEKDM